MGAQHSERATAITQYAGLLARRVFAQRIFGRPHGEYPGQVQIIRQVANLCAPVRCLELRVVTAHEHRYRTAFTDGKMAAQHLGALSAGTTAG